MKLNTDLFLVGMVEIEHKKILVHTDQTEMTKGKNVVIFYDLHNRMIKPHNPEIGVWKENVQRKPTKRVKPTLAMLIEKYQQQLEEDRRCRVARGRKQSRRHARGGEPRRRTMQHSTDQEPGIRQNP
jgi:hypothetical protein